MQRPAIMFGIDDDGAVTFAESGQPKLTRADLSRFLKTMMAARMWTAAGWRRYQRGDVE